MTRLARTVPLLLAFYLLASAATATAECAWVLWLDQISISGGNTKREWTPVSVKRARLRATTRCHNEASEQTSAGHDD